MDDDNEDYDPESVSFEKMDKAAKKKRKRSRFHDEPQFSDEDDEGTTHIQSWALRWTIDCFKSGLIVRGSQPGGGIQAT